MQSNQTTSRNRINRKLAFGLLFGIIVLAVVPRLHAQNGTWTNLNPVLGNASGSWAAATNWNNSVIASGANSTANFATLTIGTNSTVTLDAAWTLGNLIFANVTPSAAATNWIINASSTNATAPVADNVTLADGAGMPVISVTNAVATFNAPLFGTSGFSLTGGGTLRLNVADTNGSGYLTGPIDVNQGILQANNAGALGEINFTNAAYGTNGGTIEIINGIAVNNEVLYAGGAGNGGTNGVLYANNPTLNSTSTRWGLSTLNSSGTSANSGVATPAIIMMTNITIRVDGVAGFNGFSNKFLVGYIASSTNGVANVTNSFFTLTKTGSGMVELERGMMVSNVIVQAGSLLPDSANAFNSVQQWTVNSGGALLNNQNETFNATTISLEVDAGGLYDVNFRGNGTPGNDNNVYVQNLGTLTGAGTITCGERGEIALQTLTITSTNNSYFTGLITDTNGDTMNLGKTGAGSTLRLSGTNSYHGSTLVSGAGSILLVDGTEFNGSNYLVNGGATLGGTGSLTAPISLNGGTLLAGDGGGTFTVATVIPGGGDTTIVSNANLTVTSSLGSSAGYLSTLYLSNAMLQLPLLSSGPSAYVSTLNNDGEVTLVYTTPNPSVGQFPLIAVSSIGGLAGGGLSGITLVPPASTTAHLSNNVANGTLDVVVTGIPALVWQGTPAATWSIGGSADWLIGSTATTYTESGGSGPFVIFNDTAPGSSTVNLTTTVSPKGITVNNSVLNYTNTGTGAIGGTGGLLKQGTAALVIANSGSNYYSGTVAIQGGEVRVGNGGTAGNLGTGPVNNGGQLTFNRSDNVTVPNAISGAGLLVKSAGGTATLTGITNYGGNISINAGTLALATGGTIVLSNNIAGNGAFGAAGGTLVLEGTGNAWAGGTLISAGTLQVGDANSPGSLPGSVTNNGTLAFGGSETITNNISGSGELLLLANTSVTLAGLNTYSGPTVVLGSTLTAGAANYPGASVLTLGDQTGGSGLIGTVYVPTGDLVLGGLNAGGNTTTPNQISMQGTGQSIIINGNVSVGATQPSGASVLLQPTGTGVSVVINTNGGTVQIGLGATSSGVNPDNVEADFSQIDNCTINLGTTGLINLGTLDGNPGPQAGATVANELILANISNSITAGTLVIGAGGRQLIPDLYLGPGTNIINVATLDIATGGRDGGDLAFNPDNSAAGGVTIGGVAGGATRAEYNQGVGTSGSSAGFTSVVDFTGATVGGPGGTASLLFDAMVIGNVPDRTASGLELGWTCTFNFGAGTLNANSVSLSGGCYPGAAGSSTMNISGGTASLGAVSLTESAAPGTLNITGGTVTVSNITYTAGLGTATLNLANATLNVALGASGNPATAPVQGGSFTASGTVNLGFSGSGFTRGQFPLISYTGSIQGDGYAALNLTSLPAGVSGYLYNNAANSSVDVVITSAPVYVNTNPTNITTTVAGGSLTLSWPADHTGWQLQVQTNSLSAGLGTNWATIPNSQLSNSYTVPIGGTNGAVFYRMVYQ